MNATVLFVICEVHSFTSYAIGVVLALFILVYLLYSLIKPEKF
jgi:K+-transporting ATPase KdpF subunit